MKTIIKSILTILVSVVPALAAAGKDSGEVSMLVVLFLAFGALVLLSQLVPGLTLFCTMIKELFSHASKGASLTTAKESKKS